MDSGFIRVGKGLRAYPESAAQRYHDMGFPDEYKVVLKYNPDINSSFSGWYLTMYRLERTYTKWLGKFNGYKWIVKKNARVSLIHMIEDEDVDIIARAWLFELQRFERIMDHEREMAKIDALQGH